MQLDGLNEDKYNYIANEKLGLSLSGDNFIKFWQEVRAMKSSPSSVSPIVDDLSCESTITDNFSTKFSSLLNSDDLGYRDGILECLLSRSPHWTWLMKLSRSH